MAPLTEDNYQNGEQDMPHSDVAVLAATRMVLWDVVDRLRGGEVASVHDELVNLRSDLRRLWNHDSTDFRDTFLNELERICFRLKHPPRAATISEDSHRLSFYCIKCDAIAQGSGMKLVCPVCNDYDWLEAVTYRVEQDG